MECLHTLMSKINNVHVYCISIVVCLETGINCCAMHGQISFFNE